MADKTNKPRTKAGRKKPVGAFAHLDKRRNIPTAEMQGLVPDEDAQPVRVEYPRPGMPAGLYRRNADYDPQLVWRGKEEEDGKPLTIDAVPIYVQEKISPLAIIEDLRRHCAANKAEDVARRLFGDFNGIADDARVEFYKHAQNWTNRMILGDSLQVMASLGYKENLRGSVQCFYMDPPYGIKYASNWQPSTKSTAVKDGDDTGEPESVRAFRDAWKDGVHSYLSYLRDRLRAARDLLTESGSAFVQISDENVHLVRCIMDEVFGRENFVSDICFRTAMTKPTTGLNNIFDHILWYAKEKDGLKFRPIRYHKESLDGYETSPLQASAMQTRYEVNYCGDSHNPVNGWRVSEKGMHRLIRAGRVQDSGTLRFIRFKSDFAYRELDNIWNRQLSEQNKIYVVQTNESVIERCMLMTTDPGDLVFDPTCGSGTTAIVAEQWGRRWITCDTSRVSLALARARLMAKSHDYYLLADSAAGAQKEAETTGIIPAKKTFGNDIRHGFVCRRVPHITLGDIAKNETIDDIWDLWEETLQPLLKTINAETGNNYQAWQVPEEAAKAWSNAAKTAHRDFVNSRAKRQQQINESINKNARSEQLHDAPFADKSAVRVTGPFTVESLSPYRMMPTGENPARPRSETENESRFWDIVYQNLKAAGVQTNKQGGRITFDDLQSCPHGERLQFTGAYTENNITRRAAVCIGPEYGTVGANLLTLAAIEAAKMGADLLIVLGYAFEAHADAEMAKTKNIGKVKVLRARMNADLQMANRLQTGKDARDNLFVVFGEPDINLQQTPDGQMQVEMRGLDIYNPATGEVKSSGADDIYCWFIDTDYDEQSFFVRHAYFCGGGKNPHKKHLAKLKAELRAEIDEDAWAGMYSTTSRPFAPPASGKIAVKAINHYGDEVIKVFATPAPAA